MHNGRFVIFSLLLGWACFASAARSMGDSLLITPADAARIIAEDSTAVLLDVRTEAEFKGETGHLGKAILIPVQVLAGRVGELSSQKSHTIIVYCRTGHRSTAATEFLREKGFKAYNMSGGITRWLQEKRPTVKE